MRAVDLLRRALKMARAEPGPASDDQAGVIAECFAAVIAATRREGDIAKIAQALGATLAVLGFYHPEHREKIRAGFSLGLERGRDAALDEEGIGRA